MRVFGQDSVKSERDDETAKPSALQHIHDKVIAQGHTFITEFGST